MPLKIDPKTIQELRMEGYNDAEISRAIQEMEAEARTKSLQQGYQKATELQKLDPRLTAQHSAFAYNPQDNLVKWQLELNDILERAEHILRGDILKFENGHLIYKANENTEENNLNEYGVREVLKVLAMYLNRNTILSDYKQEEINEKVLDFGKELTDLFYMKYEDFGLTKLSKRKNFPMLMREMIDLVHSAYKRALDGGERRSLREARSLAQTETIFPSGTNIQTGEARKSRGILNPFRYLGSKYK